MSLAEVFDPKANSLSHIRLALAAGVIVCHAVFFAGFRPSETFGQLIEFGFVDGFFAISGFLIVASWVQRPSVIPFVTARALRIIPAFWVALAMTAFVLAPGALLASGRGLPPGFWDEAWTYVWSGLGLFIHQPDIAGSPSPTTGSWNQPLWTLYWEFACYILVAALGVFGLVRGKTMVVLLAGSFSLALLAVAGIVPFGFALIARFLLMFTAGGALYLYRERIPATWWGVVATVPLVGVSAMLPDYRLLGALPLAYALVVGGSLLRRKTLRTDLSYGIYVYAFPIQVWLAMLGVTNLVANVLLALACTLPFAAASWYLIERPALRLKKPLGDKLEQASLRFARVGVGSEPQAPAS